MSKVNYLFVLLLCFAGFSSMPGVAQESSKVRLLIHDFVQDTVESLDEEKLEISPNLRESFSKYDEVDILNNQDFPDLSLENLQLNGDSLRVEGVDAVVFGSYVILGEYIKIQSVAFAFEDGLFHRVNYSRGKKQALNTLIEEVRDNIFETLVDVLPVLQQSVKKIAFKSDYETVSGKYDDHGMMKNKSEAMAREVMENIEYSGPANTEVISWKKVKDYLNNPSDVALRTLDADMFVTLTYVFSGTEIVALRTDFDIIEVDRGRIQKREFTLPELKSDYYKNIDFQEFITNEMLAFLDRIVSSSGQWSYISFPNKSAIKTTKKSVLQSRAQNFALRSEFYLSSYHYYEMMEMFPEEVNISDIRLQVGFNKLYTSRYAEADEEFDFVLAADPKNNYAYLGKSLVNYYEGNSDVALDYLEKAKEIGVESNFLVEVLKGYYFYELGQYQESLDAFNTSLQEEPGTIRIRIINNLSEEYIKIHIGLCHVGLGNYQEAINYYLDIKKQYSYNKDVDYYLGNAYSKKGIDEYFVQNYGQALKDFNESRKYFSSKNVNDYIRTAYIYEEQFEEASSFIQEEIDSGHYDPMFIWFDQALDVRNYAVEKYIEKGDGSFDANLLNEAVSLFKKNLEVNTNDALSNYYIGELYTLIGEFEMGLVFMEKAYEFDDVSFDIQLGLMQAYLLNNRFDDCEKLEKSLSKLYRKFSVPTRFTALMDYLYISSQIAQDKKAKKSTKELDNLLKEEVIIDSWFYEPYLSWLNSCNCSEETRTYLTSLTARMKERNL